MNAIPSNSQSTAEDDKRSELVRHVSANWGFLIPRYGQVTMKEFATTIRRYSSDVRAEAVASELDAYEGTIWRDWKGVHAKWTQSES